MRGLDLVLGLTLARGAWNGICCWDGRSGCLASRSNNRWGIELVGSGGRGFAGSPAALRLHQGASFACFRACTRAVNVREKVVDIHGVSRWSPEFRLGWRRCRIDHIVLVRWAGNKDLGRIVVLRLPRWLDRLHVVETAKSGCKTSRASLLVSLGQERGRCLLPFTIKDIDQVEEPPDLGEPMRERPPVVIRRL